MTSKKLYNIREIMKLCLKSLELVGFNTENLILCSIRTIMDKIVTCKPYRFLRLAITEMHKLFSLDIISDRI